MKKVLMCFAFLAASISFAAAQWTPLTAGIRETTEIVKDGVASQQQVREGVFLRTSDGSTLTHYTKLNGIDVPGHGTLFNNTGLKTYLIDYRSGSAKPSRWTPMKPLTPDVFAGIVTVGNSNVAGYDCRLIPILLDSPNKASQRIGEECILDAQSLVLKEETRIAQSDGSVVHVLTEKFNIKLNTSPNASDFDISKFTITDVLSEPLK